MSHSKAVPARALVGKRIVNEWGIDLGRIEDVVINLQEGSIAYAVMSFKSAAGAQNKLFAVPWDSISFHPESGEFIFDIPRDVLEEAPGFDKNSPPEAADPAWATQVYGSAT
jgi:sporulation protein YlmC with PRC-barrel domain